MLSLVAAFSVAFQTPPSDPYHLSIGRRGTVTVQPGKLTDLRSGKEATPQDVATAASGKNFVFLGESHATTAHQQMEAMLVDALVHANRQVAVGLEMFQRPKQDVLDQWSAGTLSEDQFLIAADWKAQWGFPYSFYRPVFEEVKLNHLALVGLNVPRDWVRTVGKGGYAALPTSAKLQLPPQLFTGNKDHRQVFDTLMGGHSMAGASMDAMYAAQVLWDEGMADTAIKYRAFNGAEPNKAFVVIAGSGHVMYGQGINYRIARRKAGTGITVVMIQSDVPIQVSRGLADFVFVSAPTEEPKG